MAPKRSTSSSQSSKSSSSKKNKKSSSLQQSTLSFSLGKGASSQKKGKAKKSSSFSASSKAVEEVEISSDDDGEEEPREHKQEELDDLELRLQDEEELEQKVEVKELNVKGKEWTTGYIEAKRMMGKVEPIHAEEQTKVDTILRIFDLDFRYGPCTSLSRMDRWNRAERLGLEPPSYVKDILLTRQGKEDTKLKESVFYGAV